MSSQLLSVSPDHCGLGGTGTAPTNEKTLLQAKAQKIASSPLTNAVNLNMSNIKNLLEGTKINVIEDIGREVTMPADSKFDYNSHLKINGTISPIKMHNPKQNYINS